MLVLVFHIFWDVEFTRQNYRHMSDLLFSFSVCHITITYPSTLKTLLLFLIVAMLSRYHSPVNCGSSKVESNFTHKINYRYCCHCAGLEFV